MLSEVEGLGVTGSLAPDAASDVDDELHLGPLLVFGDHVAFHHRREAALRAEGQLLERNVLRRRFDRARDGIGIFELADLRAHQPKNDDFAFRHET